MGSSSTIDITWRSALLLAVCLPVLLSALILMWQKVERKAALFLALFLVAAVIKVIPQIIGFAGFYDVYPGLTFAPFSVELFFGPLLLFHAHYLMRNKPPNRYKWLFLPGLIQLIYYCWAFIFLGGYKNKWQYNGEFHAPYIIPVETLLSVFLFVFCWFKIIQLTRQYERYLDHHESTLATFKPVWIYRLLIALTVLLVLFIMVQFVPTFITDMSYVEEFPLVVCIMMVLTWVGLDAVRKLNEKFPKIQAPDLHKNATKSQSSENNPALGLNELTQAMDTHQWYLEPKLSLRETAERLASNESYVSRAINQGLGKSFNQYINELRVAHAKKKLKTEKAAVLNIALDSGFNSKATFNRVFKEFVGKTPSQYKRENLH